MNPFSWIKNNLLALGAVVVSVLVAVIASLRRQKADIKSDIAKAEAEQLKRSQKALEDAQKESDEIVKKARNTRDFSDID